MPGSLSQINRRGTRPSCWISSHEPSSRSSVLRVGIIRPVMNRECAAVITSTGSSLRGAVLERDLARREPQIALRRIARLPRPAGRPDRPADAPAAAASRSPGTTDRPRPARPARRSPSPACPASSSSSARTRGSNGVNDVGPGDRSYLGGASEPTALITVVREIPNRCSDPRLRHALRRQPPDQRPVLQSDHSPIVECSLFTAETVQFSSAVDIHSAFGGGAVL